MICIINHEVHGSHLFVIVENKRQTKVQESVFNINNSWTLKNREKLADQEYFRRCGRRSILLVKKDGHRNEYSTALNKAVALER